MIQNTMRYYLKRRGISLNKAKSWTLTSEVNQQDLEIKSWFVGRSLLYQVRQGSVIVVFRGQYGMEDVKAYSDSNISFVVDTVANDLRLQHFVAKWVSKLRKEKYLGSWTLKKELRKDKLKTLDKLNKSLEKQYQDSVKYGKHRSVKNPRKYGLGKVDSFIGMIHNQDNFYSYGNARSHYNKHYKYEDGNK